MAPMSRREPLLVKLGSESAHGSPEDLGKWVRDETAKWSKVGRERHITAE